MYKNIHVNISPFHILYVPLPYLHEDLSSMKIGPIEDHSSLPVQTSFLLSQHRCFNIKKGLSLYNYFT